MEVRRLLAWISDCLRGELLGDVWQWLASTVGMHV